MIISPKKFDVSVDRNEINIIHKALTVLRDIIIKEQEKNWGKGYLEEVKTLIKETKKYW